MAPSRPPSANSSRTKAIPKSNAINVATKTTSISTSTQTSLPSPPPPSPSRSSTSPPNPTTKSYALSKPISFYESKSRTIHAAIQEVWSGASFLSVAKKYNQSPEALAVGFAVFGKMAMDIGGEKGIYTDTAYRAMALMKDGYDENTPMSRALPLAISQKRDEGRAAERKERGGARIHPSMEDDGQRMGTETDMNTEIKADMMRENGRRGDSSGYKKSREDRVTRDAGRARRSIKVSAKGYETRYYGKYGGTMGQWDGQLEGGGEGRR